MIDIQVTGDGDEVLAELIASTLHGHIAPDPQSDLATVGRLLREQLEDAERRRLSRQQIETVDFQRIDDEIDFSDV
jgi:hypothetical protein